MEHELKALKTEFAEYKAKQDADIKTEIDSLKELIRDLRGDVGEIMSMHVLSDKIGGERQSLIDGITNYLYIEKFPTLATPPSYTDFEQQPATA